MRRQFLSFFAVRYALFVAAETPRCPTLNGTDSSLDFPLVRQTFPHVRFEKPTRSPLLGGQNLTYCCIAVIEDWLQQGCVNSSDIRIGGHILDENAQFPCGATFRGDSSGASSVKASYRWASTRCRGWELSNATNRNHWLQMLVGFLLPAVVFALNVPRRRKLSVWNRLFPEEIGNYRIVSAFIGAIIAMIIVTIDTVIWLCTVFAAAGPLVLSGLYEAWLDKRVVGFLDEKIQANRLPLGLRARILFSILCGNLDLFPAWSDTMNLAKYLDRFDGLPVTDSDQTANTPLPDESAAESDDASDLNSPGLSRTSRRRTFQSTRHGFMTASRSLHPNTTDLSLANQPRDSVQTPAAGLMPDQHQQIPAITVSVEASDSPRDTPTVEGSNRSISEVSSICHSAATNEDYELKDRSGDLLHPDDKSIADASEKAFLIVQGAPRAGAQSTRVVKPLRNRTRVIEKVGKRLRAMLSCQYSFGSTIGAPVIFYIGSFIYAVLELQEDYGDNDVAHALSFGMWWMVIPYVAIVAGFLLGGNNPNTLEGIVGAKKSDFVVGGGRPEMLQRYTDDLGALRAPSKVYSSMFERVYEAAYVPASMWNRGKSKQKWLLVLCVDALTRYKSMPDFVNEVEQPMTQLIRDTVMFRPLEWVYLSIFAFFMVMTPCLVGFLTTYWTPQIGLSCRSLTFLVYMVSQILLLFLWTLRTTWRDKYWCQGMQISRSLSRDAPVQTEVFWDEVDEMVRMARMDTHPHLHDALQRRESLVRLFPRDEETALGPRGKHMWSPAAEWIHYSLCILGFGAAVFSGIGGTLMQLIGVYRSCFCKANTQYWLPGPRRDSAWLGMSTNTQESIWRARHDWTILGSASVVFLIASCYIGWWYQRRLRVHFKTVAGRLDRPVESTQTARGSQLVTVTSISVARDM